MVFIEIANNNQEISSTNYYETPYSEKYFYLSVNAGAIRLLVPNSLEDEFLAELKSIKKIIITFKKDQINILLEDYTQTPYQIFITYSMCDRKPLTEDNNREIPFLVYIYENNNIKLASKKIAYLDMKY